MSGGAVLLAAALDATWREPAAALHPVRAIGKYLDAAARVLPAAPPVRAALTGATAWAAGAAASTAIGVVAARTSARTYPWLDGLALWPLFAHRMLLDEVAAVERALSTNLGAGRTAVARLVSRDVSTLTESQVRQAAIESLGENLSDSVVAPLLAYAAGGLPAATLYRFANTADATWGYRTPAWKHAGMPAARADDLLNLLPARLTGLAILSGRASPTALHREAKLTPSPNAGWPMAALALRLGIRLEKPGIYILNRDGRLPTHTDTDMALRITCRAGWAMTLACAALAAARTHLKGRQQ